MHQHFQQRPYGPLVGLDVSPWDIDTPRSSQSRTWAPTDSPWCSEDDYQGDDYWEFNGRRPGVANSNGGVWGPPQGHHTGAHGPPQAQPAAHPNERPAGAVPAWATVPRLPTSQYRAAAPTDTHGAQQPAQATGAPFQGPEHGLPPVRMWPDSNAPAAQAPPQPSIPMAPAAQYPNAAAVRDTNDGWIQEDVTTVMLRNIPNKYTLQLLLTEFNEEGFANTADFVYMPIDTDFGVNRGYAFVNFRDPKWAVAFREAFQGRSMQRFRSAKVVKVDRAMVQGFHPNLAKVHNQLDKYVSIGALWFCQD
mmetsp:Transcript_84454/g.192501  ORF Transcript_84454/g.192501 Transcript_84454/m.192501 type:complete len:306 (-) Transcript_84454:277-1194(-)